MSQKHYNEIFEYIGDGVSVNYTSNNIPMLTFTTEFQYTIKFHNILRDAAKQLVRQNGRNYITGTNISNTEIKNTMTMREIFGNECEITSHKVNDIVIHKLRSYSYTSDILGHFLKKNYSVFLGKDYASLHEPLKTDKIYTCAVTVDINNPSSDRPVRTKKLSSRMKTRIKHYKKNTTYTDYIRAYFRS
jgi:hypothetical protein